LTKAREWLTRQQNDDGGFGESPKSYDEPKVKGRGPSTATQTAWAIMGLMAAGDSDSDWIRRGVQFLIERQRDDGSWVDEPWTGTGFPRVFYLRYDYYDDYFPLLALAQYQRGGSP
jgi:squalene-hopene/tetraprenyl-beta-curcumene cyclase